MNNIINKKLSIILEEEDLNKIQSAHYLTNSTADLINRLALKIVEPENSEEALKRYMVMYSEYYENYEKIKIEIEKKYKPTDKEYRIWTIDFEEGTIIFEE